MIRRTMCRCLATCLSILYFYIHTCWARRCTDLALSTSDGVAQVFDLNCQKFLKSQGVAEMFVLSSSNGMDGGPLCSQLQPDLANIFATHNCSCPPGFTDATYGKDGLGLLVGLKNIDIARISCQEQCPPAYTNIFQTRQSNACACWNQRGCTFEDRTLLRLTPPEQYIQQGIIMMPDSLLYDSSLVHCRQPFCAQSVSPHDIMVCAEQNIEYTYCNECPSECLRPHRSCTVDTTSRFCNVLCDSGYIRVFDSEQADFDCVARTICPLHFYNNATSNSYGDFFEQKCAPCPRGYDNANVYARDCLLCAAGKMNDAAGSVCNFCVGDSVVLPGTNICTPCVLLEPDTSVRRGATNCSDTVCRPSISSSITNCLSRAEKHKLSSCRHPGFGLDFAGNCGMCARNYVPKNVSEIIVTSGADTVTIWYHRCQECPAHFFTGDVGMIECIACAPFHVRESMDNFCSVCPPGKAWRVSVQLIRK